LLTPAYAQSARPKSPAPSAEYRSISEDGLTQYNVTLHRFKDGKIFDEENQKQFFEDYLTTRAFYSRSGKIMRKAVSKKSSCSNIFQKCMVKLFWGYEWGKKKAGLLGKSGLVLQGGLFYYIIV